MLIPDIINGSLEFVGGLFWWTNVKRILKDKTIQGVNWSTQAFFTGWGIWNLYYYPSLHQWCSLLGGIFLVLGNVSWVAMAIYYERKIKMKVNDMDVDIKKLSLILDDILVINIKDASRLSKSKAEEYAKRIKIYVEGMISNKVLITCGDVELTKITREEEMK